MTAFTSLRNENQAFTEPRAKDGCLSPGLRRLLYFMVAPLFFIETLEVQVVPGAMMGGAAIQMALFKTKGFVRLLGIGHILWVPMVIWLAIGFEPEQLASPFGLWIAAVMTLNSISLIIDGVDVACYIKGERAPSLNLGS